MGTPTYRIMVNGADKGTADDIDSAYRALTKHATVLENGSVVVPAALFVPVVASPPDTAGGPVGHAAHD